MNLIKEKSKSSFLLEFSGTFFVIARLGGCVIISI